MVSESLFACEVGVLDELREFLDMRNELPMTDLNIRCLVGVESCAEVGSPPTSADERRLLSEERIERVAFLALNRNMKYVLCPWKLWFWEVVSDQYPSLFRLKKCTVHPEKRVLPVASIKVRLCTEPTSL